MSSDTAVTAGSVLRAVSALEEKLKASLYALDHRGLAAGRNGPLSSDDAGGPVSGTKDGGSLGSPNSVLRHNTALSSGYSTASPASSAAASPGDLSISSDLDGLYGVDLVGETPRRPRAPGLGPGLTTSSRYPHQDGGLVAHHLRRADALLHEVPETRALELLSQLEGYNVREAVLVHTQALKAERALLDAQLASNAHTVAALSAMSASMQEVEPTAAVALHLARLSVLDAAAVDLTSCRAHIRVLADDHLAKSTSRRTGLRSAINSLVPGLDIGPVVADDTHEAAHAGGHYSTEHHAAADAGSWSDTYHVIGVEANHKRGGIFTWLAAQLPGVIAGACGVMLASALASRTRSSQSQRSAESGHAQSAREAALSSSTPQQLLDQGFHRVAVTHGGHAIFHAEQEQGGAQGAFRKVPLSSVHEHPIFA